MAAAFHDDPRWRLFWTIPLACVLTMTALGGFLHAFTVPSAPQTQPLDVQLVELPPPAAVQQPPQVESPAPPEAEEPLPDVTPIPVPPKPQPRPSKPQQAERKTPTSAPPAASPPSPSPPSPVAAPIGGPSMGARALFQPPPDIPEALRDRKFNFAAVARFHVAADGTATVDLVEPTPEPSLNRAVLDALKKWRFFPALKNGKAVASMLDIRIPIVVQ